MTNELIGAIISASATAYVLIACLWIRAYRWYHTHEWPSLKFDAAELSVAIFMAIFWPLLGTIFSPYMIGTWRRVRKEKKKCKQAETKESTKLTTPSSSQPPSPYQIALQSQVYQSLVQSAYPNLPSIQSQPEPKRDIHRKTPFVGFRGFNVQYNLLHGPALYSINQQCRWAASGPTKAECALKSGYSASLTDWRQEYEHRHPGNVIPGQRCSCGLYFLFELDAIAGYLMTSNDPKDLRNQVVAGVAAWGKVIAGSDGGRAQFAQPIAFLEVPGITNGEILDVLSNRYNAPALTRKEFESYVKNYHQENPNVE